MGVRGVMRGNDGWGQHGKEEPVRGSGAWLMQQVAVTRQGRRPE